MHDEHHHPDAAADGLPSLWDRTVQALATADIDVVHAGDGRPGAVLEPGPHGPGIAVRWQPTHEQPLPGKNLTVNACRGELPTARHLQNPILQTHLNTAGLRTAYSGRDLAVVHPDVVIPGGPVPDTSTPGGGARPAVSAGSAPAQGRLRRGLWARFQLARKA